MTFSGSVQLNSLEDWTAWRAANPGWCDLRDKVVDLIRLDGFVDPIDDVHVTPSTIDWQGSLREGVLANGLNSRCRAVLLALKARGLASHHRIFGTEAVTRMALYLRGRYPYYLGSEFAASEADRASLFPVPHQDLMDLDLPGEAFTFVMTNDVLEHVPCINRALQSIFRILRPGGWHIGTVPFHYDRAAGVIKAKATEDRIEYLTEPEYHGNPISPSGSLVFEIPGWDILDRARSAGFSHAGMEFIWSAAHGVVGPPLGIFVLALQK